MIDKFLDNLMEYANTIMTVYYEEVPKNASYPYGVIPTLSVSSLNYGFQCLFDIELYVNEFSDVTVESLCDKLREGLDRYSYNSDDVSFHIDFENIYLSKQTEQDFTMRRVTFIARIF